MELYRIGVKIYKINPTKLQEMLDYLNSNKPKPYSENKKLL